MRSPFPARQQLLVRRLVAVPFDHALTDQGPLHPFGEYSPLLKKISMIPSDTNALAFVVLLDGRLEGGRQRHTVTTNASPSPRTLQTRREKRGHGRVRTRMHVVDVGRIYSLYPENQCCIFDQPRPKAPLLSRLCFLCIPVFNKAVNKRKNVAESADNHGRGNNWSVRSRPIVLDTLNNWQGSHRLKAHCLGGAPP
jgi:hypothetical protein